MDASEVVPNYKRQLFIRQREIAYLQNYIELQARYHKGVYFLMLTVLNQYYPLLLNAFKHGVEKLTEDAYIYMSLKTEHGAVYIEKHLGEFGGKSQLALVRIWQQRLQLLYLKHCLDILW